MNGGLYRSTHATPDGRPSAQEGVTVVSVDAPASEPQRQSAPEGGSTAGQSAIMAIGSLVSRVIGFVRNALIGMVLGQAVGNAYTGAQFLPGQIYELLLGGILSSVLIPLLVRRRKAEPDGGQEFTQRLLSFAVVMLGIATVLVVLAAPLITAIQTSGDNTDQAFRELVTNFSYLILPIIFFTGLSALIGAVLNVRGHFAAPMWAPILNNIVVIAVCGVFLLAFGTDKELTAENISTAELVLIGAGTLLGMVVQAVGLLPALRKVGFRWKWRWAPRELGLREIGHLAGWMLCYVAANQIAVFALVRALNSAGGEDNPGALAFNNVFLLMMMAHGIIGVSVITALLPKMSAAAAEGRLNEVVDDLSRGIRLVSAALAPIVVAYAVLSGPIAVFLFQGGRITNADALDMGTVLTVAAFAVLPLSISFLCTNVFYALQGNKTAALINLPVVAARITGYFVLAAILDASLTAAGMTAANGISYLLSALISLAVLRRRIGRLNLGSVLVALLKVAVAAGVAAGLALFVVQLLPGSGEPDGRVEAIVQIAVGGAVILIAYLGTALLLRVHEVSQVVGMVRRKIGR
ncbi:putative peptidoglycan lipid II flippase [Actinoplanes campanulatus]|uniref:Putative peptidoglycan lipid II flippase n=1 Tax=Actinoplanes campanulatus TaxID=113559 RepID=A0A7W5FJG7_9ACTN|nr:murein biosynthesis integral membrane protein MurJ [Actinoplanes campanulatus]MBB3100495.1 putative peptidoglycan lipid II flippase [Actinoplanes campanulatus]GGN25172.1 lipid II flippase MurJ [Actinoplanes campanulatus]GID39467.1 lipid II flippase MurJ [Actinoplanes campanulatus]